MEYPETGEQCGLEMCRTLDFLPIKCENCKQIFCKNHNLPHDHNCIVLEKVHDDFNIPKKTKEFRNTCSLPDCKKWELVPVQCSFCNQLFCLRHKHQIDHDCSHYVPPSNPMAAAAAKVEELTAKLASPKFRKTKKNDKLAAKVQLMKMKANAIGSKHLAIEERVFFLISLPKLLSKQDFSVYVSHHWTVGKAVDAIAEYAKVPNKNNLNTSDRLCLFHACNGLPVLPFDVLLKELIEKEYLLNGENLILEYSAKDTSILKDLESYKS